MEQTKALNALAPYIALTKSATSPSAAADLIERATSAHNTFIFAELLEAPEIRALTNSPSHSQYLKLLEVFSYGTYQTYIRTPSLPKLNDTQITKLRQLSFLTLATNPSNLGYNTLLYNLGLKTQRELENLVISIIYAGLVEATLDPHNERVIVTSISPLRDLEPNSLPAMLKTLDNWSSRCESTLIDLEKYIARFKTDALKRYRYKAALDTEVETLVQGKGVENGEVTTNTTDIFPLETGSAGRKADTTASSKRGSGRLDEKDENAMDIDSEDFSSSQNSRSVKKRGLGTK